MKETYGNWRKWNSYNTVKKYKCINRAQCAVLEGLFFHNKKNYFLLDHSVRCESFFCDAFFWAKNKVAVLINIMVIIICKVFNYQKLKLLLSDYFNTLTPVNALVDNSKKSSSRKSFLDRSNLIGSFRLLYVVTGLWSMPSVPKIFMVQPISKIF